MKDPDAEVALRAKISLGTIEAIAALKDPDAKVRFRALETLETAGLNLARKAVPGVVEMLDDPENQVSWKAHDLLFDWRTYIPEAIPLLLAIIKDRNKYKLRTRDFAVFDLASLLDGPAHVQLIPPLRAALRDQEQTIRFSAIRGVCSRHQNASELLPDLRHLLDEDEEIVQYTMHFLWVQALFGRNYSEGEAKILLPKLLELANKPKMRDYGIRAVAAVGLNNPDALKVLIDCLKPEEDPEICDDAAHQIGTLWGAKGKAAVPALIKVLGDERRISEKVRITAAIALGNIGSAAAPAVPKLMELVKQKGMGTQLRLGIARILRKIDDEAGKQAQSILDQELKTPNPTLPSNDIQ